MIRITVTYRAAPGARFDHAYYQSQHRTLLERLLGAHGLQRVEMDQCLADGAGGPPPIVAGAHLVFNDLAGFQAGMAGGRGNRPAGMDAETRRNLFGQAAAKPGSPA